MLRRLARVASVTAVAAFGGLALGTSTAWAEVCDPSRNSIPEPPPGYTPMNPPDQDCPSSEGPDPCADANPAIGAVCNDGSLYVGLSPDGNVKMFTTRCDAGKSWNGSACVGMGGINWGVQWGTYNVITDISNTVTGRANTTALASGYSDTWAAKYCENLTAHGKTDWYLPAKNELNVIAINRSVANISNTLNRTSIAGILYWSSTENSGDGAWYQRMSDGYQGNGGKYQGFLVRCVRRD